MSNYGPPLRFKAVQKSNGEEAAQTWLKGDKTPFPSFDEDPILSLVGCERFAIYQSTGHHDTNSKEIFFGDVVLHINDAEKKELMSIKFSAFDGLMLYDIKDGFSRLLRRSGAITVIGNIHHSREELERRAKEARGDE